VLQWRPAPVSGAAQLCALLRAPIGVPVPDRPYTCGRCSIRSVPGDQHVRCMATAVREGASFRMASQVGERAG
jgi:hypothetical protein